MLACWAMPTSKCHRFVTDAVDREVSIMAAEQAVDEARSASVADMAAVGALRDDDDDD